MKKIIIIGAGASGVMCAIKIKQKNPQSEILILEANKEPLKKLSATGNGRCNLSHKDIKISHYDGYLPSYVKELILSYDIQEEFKQLGLYTKYLGNLLYPMSEQALSVKKVLLENCRNLNIPIICNTEVTQIQYQDSYLIKTLKKTYDADCLVVSMGTPAGKLSGMYSRKDILSSLQIPFYDFIPSLTQMELVHPLPLKGIRIKGLFTLNNHQEKGELLFTDYGVSGIAIMQLSRFFKKDSILHIDMLPDMSIEEVAHALVLSTLDIEEEGFVHPRLASYLHNLPGNKAEHLKNLALPVCSIRGIPFAQVCKGGIDIRSLDQNFQSRKYPYLFFTGEILNITGDCGGYNLHFAFASASQAAQGIERIDKDDSY